MNQQLLAAGLILASSVFTFPAIASDYDAINVFGDSLVETGNLFNLTNLPPAPPYAQNFSNGDIWIDNLAEELDLEIALVTDVLSGSVVAPTEGINFSFGGALSSDVNIFGGFIPQLDPFLLGLQDQIATFTSLAEQIPVDPNALNIIWAGANDYNEAFFNPASLTAPLTDLPDVVTDNIITAVEDLADLGAREFLVVNLPSLGESPLADFFDQQSGLDISTQLNQLSAEHNLLLAEKLAALNSSPEVTISILDINSLFSSVIANPAQFNFENVVDSCLIEFNTGFMFDDVCSDPDSFLFWDNVHPTTAAHGVITELALTTLGIDEPATVPEPANIWSILTLGILGAGKIWQHQSN